MPPINTEREGKSLARWASGSNRASSRTKKQYNAKVFDVAVTQRPKEVVGSALGRCERACAIDRLLRKGQCRVKIDDGTAGNDFRCASNATRRSLAEGAAAVELRTAIGDLRFPVS